MLEPGQSEPQLPVQSELFCKFDRGQQVPFAINRSTARVESTVDQLVDCRMEKKQHMRWTGRGAQMLLHARCALINGELGKIYPMVTFKSPEVLAVAA